MCMHNPSLYMWGCPNCMGAMPPMQPPPPEFLETIRRHAQRDAQEALALDAQIGDLEYERGELDSQIQSLQDQLEMVNRNLVSLTNDRAKYPPR